MVKFCDVDLYYEEENKWNFPVMAHSLEAQESVGQILERSKVHFRPPCDGECVGLCVKEGRVVSVIIFRLQQHMSAVIL
jgi:hypothetical protein